MGKGSGSGSGPGYYVRGGHANPPVEGRQTVVQSGSRRLKSSPRSRQSRQQHSITTNPSRLQPLPKGLLNVGNTCYANAALQCLLSTALTHALIDPKASAIFRRYSSNPNILEQGSGSVDSDEERLSSREKRRKERDDRRMQENCRWLTGELKSLALDYQQDLPQSWFAPSVILDPGTITRHPDRLSKCLRPYQQEDAHEFLRALLSTLVMNGENKQLSSLFDGLLESAVTCLHCRRPSLTRDRYMDLSLDICDPHVLTLVDALDEYTKTETLSGDNKVYCQKCATKRNATKGLRLATAPSILVCHLKRFAFDSFGRVVRLHKKVQFPQRLEIGDYMSRVNKARPPPYELISVLVHEGKTCDSGHYLAYTKKNGEWYKCNDSAVERVGLDIVMNQQAYILVYEVEEMRSKHGYASPSGGKPSKSGSLSQDWIPSSMEQWRDRIMSLPLCGMDDSFLRDICWDGNCTQRSSPSVSSSRNRRRDASIDSTNQHDAHDDLSTLGESTVDSADTGKIPFRRIASSGNLKDLDRYRATVSGLSHSTGRAVRHHFFASSDPGSPDYQPVRPRRVGDLPPRLPPSSSNKDRYRQQQQQQQHASSEPTSADDEGYPSESH